MSPWRVRLERWAWRTAYTLRRRRAPRRSGVPTAPPDEGSAPGSRPHLLEVHEPVDVVYTWVDGADPAWVRRKAEVERLLGRTAVNETATAPSRFLSRDELRYSMRSLAAHAGWVRRIHLVTDGQVPGWLRTDHPQIHLVTHEQIFSRVENLPTFNSHAIESRLHHVDGLSDRYLYLNDDVFFARPVTPETFFHGNGLAKFFLSASVLDLAPPSERDLPVVAAAKNNRELIEKEFGRTVTHKFLHTPHPQLRDVLAEIEARFPEALARTEAARFRSPQDVSVAAALHHYVAYATGRAAPAEIAYAYVDLARPDALRRLARLEAVRDVDVFCLNDVHSTPAQLARQQTLLAGFLEAYFPDPSPFEVRA